ncbi:MAG: 2-amino-4-hydroxy-6-hydroxymethyldihydropteridine diphosphokinase [Proteobacteria bacterium]|nr:2-amino-4-hydroxy-6-hydroxymethyldihydropteridine diphosphokinase [Pseudomonadota bacterium]MBU1709719.1 2-amino-4-hydroxy-6-hydroxymethyldihydropteridine diphosphokinase [Pseudomonadota bacterium]
MAKAYLGFGSNLGTGKDNILAAWKKLGEIPGIRPHILSSPYRTEPVGMDSDNIFTNAAGLIDTDLACDLLLERLLAVETSMGRDRTKGRDRIIDLDLLLYDDIILTQKGLTIPHPELQHRFFVLAPLAEIAHDYYHPVLHRTIEELLNDISPSQRAGDKSSW